MIQKSNERILFLTIWTLLLLGFAIWRFWPRETPPIVIHPSVILREELITWFERAEVTDSTPTRYTVELKIQKPFIDQLGADETRKVLLGFHLMSESSVLSQGIVECVMSPEGTIHVVLPNPNRVSAKSIQLSLAQ